MSSYKHINFLRMYVLVQAQKYKLRKHPTQYRKYMFFIRNKNQPHAKLYNVENYEENG